MSLRRYLASRRLPAEETKLRHMTRDLHVYEDRVECGVGGIHAIMAIAVDRQREKVARLRAKAVRLAR